MPALAPAERPDEEDVSGDEGLDRPGAVEEAVTEGPISMALKSGSSEPRLHTCGALCR